MFQKKGHQATILGPTEASHQECPACLALTEIANWQKQLERLDLRPGTEASVHYERLGVLQSSIETNGYDPVKFYAALDSTLSTPTGTTDFIRRQFFGG